MKVKEVRTTGGIGGGTTQYRIIEVKDPAPWEEVVAPETPITDWTNVEEGAQ